MNPSRAQARPTRFPLRPIAAALLSAGIASAALAGPQDGVVRAGVASITAAGAQTRIQQSSERAVIDWRSFGIGAAEQVLFQQPSALSATLNRVTGDQVSVLLGRLDANGRVLLLNPNGILIGGGAQINVGSLIASTSNVSNANFMAGRLLFDQPGKPGAGIVNSGTITAAQGGLVALVAPHVRNDGLIQARLGKVVLGAADTFTIDLYGDELVSLALSDANVSGLVTQSGTIDVGGGRAVLVTAADAKNVLDNVVNMSGAIKADSAVAQGGTI
ncbi:MAG: filamentous hemagglutinin N-terminal domain-containing protein, partial [Burkholderiales bacterium]